MRNSILLFTILFFACGSKDVASSDESSFKIITIDVNADQKPEVGKIFKKAKIIPLETITESLIVEIDKLIESENEFFIFDKSQASILVFDENGKFLYRINKQGSGPGEYGRVVDILLNPFTDNLELLSPDGEINVYTKKGEYIETVPIPNILSVQNMGIVSENLIALYSIDTRPEGNFVILSRDKGKLIHKSKSNTSIFERNFMQILDNPLIRANDEALFCTPFTNEIYSISADGLTLKRTWDFGIHTPDYSYLNDDTPIEVIEETFGTEVGKSSVSFFNYNENNRFILATLFFERKIKNMLYQKGNDEYFFLDNSTFNKYLYQLQLTESGITGLYKPEKLTSYWNNSKFIKEHNPDLINTEKDDNPIIIKFEFADF
ncbi:6-bladed beta-propeller [Algoriphagus aquimarinus]|uniref:6-bladed beta-propeller n=1 Tax=Algoriphagus aquimarinus TaxID=237018 RepID=A0A1I0ZKK5_9BACT|nr:6-bladed beta-propeller [Algoriphagus aquimarinus]SFB24928.1 hypothetical protein SAMN04489723_10681 [Algoriphagus aquimarinus]